MIEQVELKNYGLHSNIEWDSLGKINLIIGENSCGKSFILKAIYSAMRTIEAFGRGQNNKTPAEILSDKLYWTFQTKTLGDDENLSFQMVLDGKRFSYGFGDSTTKTISNIVNEHNQRSSNTVFIPEKEVLSICGIIRKSREQDSVFGFDDTYLDLVRAISLPVQRENASYSYFALKKAYLLAQKNDMSIPVLSMEGDEGSRYGDLWEELPENAIVQESIRLYEEEVNEVL